MQNGVPWIRPPTWIDPQRRPLRNIAHHAADQARQLGQQLRLNLDHRLDQDDRGDLDPPNGGEPPGG